MSQNYWHTHKYIIIARFILILIAFALSLALAYITFSDSFHARYEFKPAPAIVWKKFRSQTHNFSFKYPSTLQPLSGEDLKNVEDIYYGKNVQYLFIAQSNRSLGVSFIYVPLSTAEAQQKITSYKDRQWIGFASTTVAGKSALVFHDTNLHMGYICESDSYLISRNEGVIQAEFSNCKTVEDAEKDGVVLSNQDKSIAHDILKTIIFEGN